MFNLPAILALIEDTESTINVALRPSSAILINEALLVMTDEYRWRGDEGELTDAEIDVMASLVGFAMYDATTIIECGEGEDFMYLSQLVYLHSTQSYVPPKCLECDGAEHLCADYPDLMLVISTGLLNADGIHWNTPDHRGRFLRGQGQGVGLTNVNTNQGGGAETVTLSVANLPAHHHAQRYMAATTGALSGTTTAPDTSSATPTNTGLDTADTGSGTAVSIIPPQRVARVFMRVLP